MTEGRQGGQGCEHRWVDAKRCYDCGEVVSDDAGGGRRRETPDGGWAEEKARELLQRLVDTVIGDPSSAVEAGTCAMDAMATTIAREERLAAALREAEERGKDIVRRADAMLTPEQLVVYDSMHEAELKAQARRDAFREAADAMNTMMQQVWAKVDPISIESWKADWLRAKAEEPSTGLHPGSEQKDEVPF